MTDKQDAPVSADFQPSDDCLTDRVILVTGAGDGIGKAVAIDAAARGAQVILLGRTSRKLEATYDAIVATDAAMPGIAVFDFESADGAAYEQLAKTIDETYGRLDGIAHIAGQLGTLTPFEHADLTEYQRVLHVNFTAAMVVTKVLLPLLAKSASASVRIRFELGRPQRSRVLGRLCGIEVRGGRFRSGTGRRARLNQYARQRR